ncbi:MAG: solute carrier family 23 protein, partial [Clostridia bacterium]|nr:solute carrier family 23 protein [Clostridia bacterium]
MQKSEKNRDLLFQLNGMPPFGPAMSLALQHVVAMIVGCVTPAIIVANTAGLAQDQRVLLIQTSLVVAAISTLLQLFPIKIGGKRFRFGSGLPVIIGISFAYVP